MTTQRFVVALATDGDVDERELCEVLDALGYRGVSVADLGQPDHEHPCPSDHCLERLRFEGHQVAVGEMCCYCWTRGVTD